MFLINIFFILTFSKRVGGLFSGGPFPLKLKRFVTAPLIFAVFSDRQASPFSKKATSEKLNLKNLKTLSFFSEVSFRKLSERFQDFEKINQL